MTRKYFLKSLALTACGLSCLLLPSAFASKPFSGSDVDVSKIFGRIRIVEKIADFDVRIDNRWPDLRVKIVDSLANECGEWELVTYAEDFTIRFVDFGEDFTIQFVDEFEGLP